MCIHVCIYIYIYIYIHISNGQRLPTPLRLSALVAESRHVLMTEDVDTQMV